MATFFDAYICADFETVPPKKICRTVSQFFVKYEFYNFFLIWKFLKLYYFALKSTNFQSFSVKRKLLIIFASSREHNGIISGEKLYNLCLFFKHSKRFFFDNSEKKNDELSADIMKYFCYCSILRYACLVDQFLEAFRAKFLEGIWSS